MSTTELWSLFDTNRHYITNEIHLDQDPLPNTRGMLAVEKEVMVVNGC